MRAHTRDCECDSADGLFRDRENGWLFGVCAGLADYLNFNTGAVRVIAVLGAIMIGWPVILAYFAAVFLLRKKPLTYCGVDREYDFWRRSSDYDRWSHR